MQKISILTAVLLSLITIVLLGRLPTDVWAGWEPATCLAKGCFCESIRSHGPIRQAANTVSSLAFVCSGTLVMIQPKKSSRMPRVYSVIMGLSIVIIGVGSAFYHASLTFVGQFFDVFGMFLLAAFMLVYVWERIWNLHRATSLGLYLGLNLFLSWLQVAIPDTRRYAFAVVLIVALLCEYYFRLKMKPQIDVRQLSFGIGLLTIAYCIWILDNTRLVCFETSLLQGHAVWHILGAASVFLLHRYYVSEGSK